MAIYIEPERLHHRTNRACAELLDEEKSGLFKAEHGKHVRAWECTPEEREILERNRVELDLRFRVWRKGRDGILRLLRDRKPKRDLRLVPIR